MKLQALIPAMEHAEEADLSAKMPWIASDLDQRLRTRVKEQVVDEPFFCNASGGQFPRQCEDGMRIASGQQFPFARLEPVHTRVALASWAMSVSARVVGDLGRVFAAGAVVAMRCRWDRCR
jgi:hypothetical protein